MKIALAWGISSSLGFCMNDTRLAYFLTCNERQSHQQCRLSIPYPAFSVPESRLRDQGRNLETRRSLLVPLSTACGLNSFSEHRLLKSDGKHYISRYLPLLSRPLFSTLDHPYWTVHSFYYLIQAIVVSQVNQYEVSFLFNSAVSGTIRCPWLGSYRQHFWCRPCPIGIPPQSQHGSSCC